MVMLHVPQRDFHHEEHALAPYMMRLSAVWGISEDFSTRHVQGVAQSRRWVPAYTKCLATCCMQISQPGASAWRVGTAQGMPAALGQTQCSRAMLAV